MRRVSSSPHFHSGASTANIMYSVAAAMAPSCIWGIYVFGLRALAVLSVSIVFAMLTEYLLGLVSREKTLWDGSALVTGMLVGMNMSPSIPLFIPATASVFAIAVAKWSFGGLGACVGALGAHGVLVGIGAFIAAERCDESVSVTA